MFALVLASSGLGFLAQVALTRTLGAVEYGVYSVAIGWGLAIAAPAMAGLDASITRFASRYHSEGQGAQLRQFAIVMAALQFVAVLIASAIVLATPIGFHASGTLRRGSLWLILYIGSTALLGSLSAFFSAFRRFGSSQFYQNVLRPLLLIAVILTLVLAGIRLSADLALASTAATSVAALCFLLVHLLIELRRAGHGGEAHLQIRRWATFTGWAQVGSLAQLSAAQVPIILLGLLSTPLEAASYAVAARVSALVTFGLAAVGTAAAPLISSAHSKDDWDSISRFAQLSARIATAIALSTTILVLVAGSGLMAVFGKGFSGAYLPLLTLLIGANFNAFTGVNVILLSMTGRPALAVLALVTGAAVTVLASIALIPSYGAIGGALSATTGTVVGNFLMVIKLRCDTGIDSTALGRRRAQQ